MSTDIIREILLFKNINNSFDGEKYIVTLDINQKDVLISLIQQLESTKIDFEKNDNKLSFSLCDKNDTVEEIKQLLDDKIDKVEETKQLLNDKVDIVENIYTKTFIQQLFSKLLPRYNGKHILNIRRREYAIDIITETHTSMIQFYNYSDGFTMAIIGKQKLEFKLTRNIDQVIKFIEDYADVIYAIAVLQMDYDIVVVSFNEFDIPNIGLKILYENEYFTCQIIKKDIDGEIGIYGIHKLGKFITYIQSYVYGVRK